MKAIEKYFDEFELSQLTELPEPVLLEKPSARQRARVLRHVYEMAGLTPPKKKHSTLLITLRLAATVVVMSVIGIGLLSLLRSKPETPPITEDQRGFHIVDGVLVSYEGIETDVVIPESVTEIGEDAFASAPLVSRITLTKNVSTVSPQAFKSCVSLDAVAVTEDNTALRSQDGALLSGDGTVLQFYFANTDGEYVIPDGVVKLGPYAFMNKQFSGVVFPEGLRYIGYNCFYGCRNLRAINLPDSVLEISEQAFYGCISAVEGHIPAGANVKKSAFYEVPFYQSQLSGNVSPGEMIARGEVTPAEALELHGVEGITREINLVCAYLRGDIQSDKYYEASDMDALHVFSNSNYPLLSEEIPAVVRWEDLEKADYRWSDVVQCRLMLPMKNSGTKLVFDIFFQNANEAMSWGEIQIQYASIFYLPSNECSAFSYTVGEYCFYAFKQYQKYDHSEIPYYVLRIEDKNGKVYLPYCQTADDYRITPAPSGDAFIVEGTLQNDEQTENYFTIIDLGGKRFVDPSSGKTGISFDCVTTWYVAGSAVWLDDAHVQAQDEYGIFTLDLDNTRYDTVKHYQALASAKEIHDIGKWAELGVQNEYLYERLAAFLALDTAKMEQLSEQADGVYSDYKSLRFGEYTIRYQRDEYGEADIFVTVNVLESGMDTIPVGINRFVWISGAYEGNFGIDKIRHLSPETPAEYAVDRLFAFGLFEILPRGEESKFYLEQVGEYILSTYSGGITSDELKMYAKKHFGIQNYDPQVAPKQEINGRYYVIGRGLMSVVNEFCGTTVTGDITAVDVQFYADSGMTVKADKVRYYLQEVSGNYTFLKSEVLFKSKYPPLTYIW